MSPRSVIFIIPLAAAALIPPIFLMVFIYRQDKTEREPISLIIQLLVFGALTVVAAGFIEGIAENVLLPLTGLSSGSIAYKLILYFLIVAWSEEGVKHFVLKRITWTNPAFDYTFDAMVYAVAVSLGFAAAENISYVFSFGLATALTRAVTAIPGHCIFAIYMGYFFGISRYCFTHFQPKKSSLYMKLSMIVPILIHGFYDFIISLERPFITVLFFAYLIILDIAAIITVKRFQKKDTAI